jgi:hypothetical protein
LLILLDRLTSPGKKAANLAILLGLGALPLVGWSIRNQFLVGSATSRTLAFHPPAFEDMDYLIRQISGWFLPDRLAIYRVRMIFFGLLALFIAIGLVAMLVWWLKQQKSRPTGNHYSVFLLFLLHTVLYPLTVLGTIVFVTPSVSIVDERILTPLLISLLVSIVCAAALAWKKNTQVIRLGISLMVFYMVILNTPRLISDIQGLHAQAQGYGGEIWQQSAAGPLLQSLQTKIIYTNDFQAVYFISGKSACILPMNENDLYQMRENIHRENGVVVIFGSHLPEFLPLDQITDGMQITNSLPDITFYQQQKN